jgi:hypothetical protein
MLLVSSISNHYYYYYYCCYCYYMYLHWGAEQSVPVEELPVSVEPSCGRETAEARVEKEKQVVSAAPALEALDCSFVLGSWLGGRKHERHQDEVVGDKAQDHENGRRVGSELLVVVVGVPQEI